MYCACKSGSYACRKREEITLAIKIMSFHFEAFTDLRFEIQK